VSALPQKQTLGDVRGTFAKGGSQTFATLYFDVRFTPEAT